MEREEEAYLALLASLLSRPPRDTRNAITRSIFGKQLTFDLSDGRLPVLTSKRLSIKNILGELLWFISGSTNTADLHARGIHFWDANASREFLDSRGLDYPEGELGPVYGRQWRKWTGADGGSVDQLAEVVRQLKKDPYSRRIVLSAWNVADLDKMALPPCHVLCQFYVDDGTLSCQLYQRSADVFLGLPFNITSYCLLTHILAHITGLKPGRFIHTLGDVHLYEVHQEAAIQQLARPGHPFPRIRFTRDFTIDDIKEEDVEVENYLCEPWIRAPMIA
jgi:thymidylate synthase